MTADEMIDRCMELEEKCHAIAPSVPTRTRERVLFDIRMHAEGYHKPWDEACEQEVKWLEEVLGRMEFTLDQLRRSA